MASGINFLTVYIVEGGEGESVEEKEKKEDDNNAEEKNEGYLEGLEVISEDEEDVEKEEEEDEEEEGRRTAKQNATIAVMVVLKVFGFALFINYIVNVAGQKAYDSCSVPGEKRQACGSWKTSERECIDMGCCYRSPFSVPNAPWCYHTASEEETNNWFLGSSSDEDNSDEMGSDKDTVNVGSIMDRLFGREEAMEETEDHSLHQRSPDGHDGMPPNHRGDTNIRNCDKTSHHGSPGHPPHHAPENPPHHAPETPPHHAPKNPPHHALENHTHSAPENPPHHAPEHPPHHAPENPPLHAPETPPLRDHGPSQHPNPSPQHDPTDHPKHEPKAPHHDLKHPQKPASGHHPPPAKTHHKESRNQETPIDCHHNMMCRLGAFETGHAVINGLPANPAVRRLLLGLSYAFMIGIVGFFILQCYCFLKKTPEDEENEAPESDGTEDKKGPPATFGVEVEGNEKVPPVRIVEAGDYADPWSDRDDVIISPEELKALMTKLQDEESSKG
ncbi:uncharacterized protein LOC144887026 isoform X2 [Branchiostoma floridae x Branchiostoma japonicum]